MNFERYTATLSTTISICENALKLLEDINSGDIELSGRGTEKEKTLQIMVEYVILKVHCLFDQTGDSISFEKVIKEFGAKMGDEKTKSFQKAYLGIKRKCASLIERFENNRNKGIAHTAKKEELGWDEEALSGMKAIWGDVLKDVNPVSDNYVFLVASNFPINETRVMLKELKNLIFYELWYPTIKR